MKIPLFSLPRCSISIFVCALGLSGCGTPPVATGDRLVSVSWVNPTPYALHSLESRLSGSEKPVRLETLPAYSEIAVNTDQPLYKDAQVKTRLTSGQQTATLESAWVSAPARKSPEREYNLRIQFRQGGLPPEANLEPAHLTRTRLGE